MKDAELLAHILKKHGVNLFDEDGKIRDFMVVLDDLFLNNTASQVGNLIEILGCTALYDEIFGGLTDERRR